LPAVAIHKGHVHPVPVVLVHVDMYRRIYGERCPQASEPHFAHIEAAVSQLYLCVLKEDGKYGQNGWYLLVASELATNLRNPFRGRCDVYRY
jgi:hypothetical protein